MAVIINLKEIFASDAQEIFTDKVNFNFNKLLELGIGEQGIQGIQGPIGSAGPPGIQGDPGERGNIWYTGVGDPNTLVFTDLMEGDFYLETNDSSIWQYQGSPASWIQITDLSEVVINILETEGSPFIRGFGELSPLDDRFITFAKRGNDNADIVLDVNLGNSSNNDTLLLTNWNERVTSIDNFPSDTDSEFNAIQHISVDHTVNPLGRYHLEFGSLYESPSSPGVKELSSLNHNLKVRYFKEATVSAEYPVSNELINKARFSLTIPESGITTNISEQGIFEFITPKYNADGSAIKDNLTVRIGTTEPITETSLMDIAVDGLDISSDAKGINLGLVRDLETFTNTVTLTSDLNGDWGMLNISDNLTGLMLRGKTYHSDSVEVINTDGAFESTNGFGEPVASSSNVAGYQGIFSDGKYLFAVSSNDSASEEYSYNGYFSAWDISNPDDPLELFSVIDNSSYFNGFGFSPTVNSYDIHGNLVQTQTPHGQVGPNSIFPLTGARDVAFAGKYGVLIRKKPTVSGFLPFGFGALLDSFIVFELDSDIPIPGSNTIKTVSWLGTSTDFSQYMIGSTFENSTIGQLDDARRVKISGNYAYVMTTNDTYSITGSSNFIAIDITNPTRPYVSNTYIKRLYESRHIDFDIKGEVAYILTNRYDGFDYKRSIIKQSIYDPNGLSTSFGTITDIGSLIALGFSEPLGSIKVVGNRIFVTAENNFSIYNDSVAPDVSPTSIASVALPTNHTGYDLEVSGRYVYIYALNSVNNDSTILTYDISDDSNPVLIEGYQDIANSRKPSKMTIVGDKIFAISTADIYSVGLKGINSPAASIGNIHSKDIKVSNSVSIAETLQVGRSATIGSGGLWVDKGVGINTDSGIQVSMSSIDPDGSSSPTGLYIRSRGLTTDTGAQGGLRGSIVKFEDIDFTNSTSAYTYGYLSYYNYITEPGNLDGYAALISNVTTSDTITGVNVVFTGMTSTDPVKGLNIDGADTNYIEGQFDTPDVFKGNHTQIASVPDKDTISSGIWTATQMGSKYNGGELHWIRIGNIVHVKGVVRMISNPVSNREFNLPHDNVRGSFVGDGMGAARTWQSSGTFCNLTIEAYGSIPTSQATLYASAGTTLTNADGQILYMDFSYEII